MALPSSWQRAFLDAHDNPELEPSKAWPQPPVMFVHMTRDTHTAGRVKESVELRHSKVGIEETLSLQTTLLYNARQMCVIHSMCCND
jgi:hypothetical protein